METFEVFEKYLNYRPLPKRDAHKDVWESLLCGAAAGIAAKTVIAPAERVKMSFQVTPAKYSLRAAIAHGRTVVTQQGFLSLWRGHSTTILRVAPYSGFSYAIHDLSEDRFKAMLDTDVLPASYKFLAGSLGGVGGTVLTYPLDVLRVRLALGATWSSALKQGGMFQGLVPTLLGIVPYAGTAWGVKQTLLEAFPGVRGRMPNVLESVVINAIAGLMGQFVSYPLDVVRRRMQVAKVRDGCPPTLSGVWRELIRTEGFSGAGKGFTLNIIKGPIALSISLTVYDLLKAHIQRNKASASASAPAPAPVPDDASRYPVSVYPVSVSYEWVVFVLTHLCEEVCCLVRGGEFHGSPSYTRADVCEVEPVAVACLLRVFLRYIVEVEGVNTQGFTKIQMVCYTRTLRAIQVKLLPSFQQVVLLHFFAEGVNPSCASPSSIFRTIVPRLAKLSREAEADRQG